MLILSCRPSICNLMICYICVPIMYLYKMFHVLKRSNNQHNEKLLLIVFFLGVGENPSSYGNQTLQPQVTVLICCYIYRILIKVFDEFNSKNSVPSRRNFSTNRAVLVIKHILLQALVQFMLIQPKIHNKISCHRPLSIHFYCLAFRDLSGDHSR